MRKTKSKKQKTVPPRFEKKLKQICELFPKVKVTTFLETHPGKAGSDYITDIILPSTYTLISKSVSSKGEITAITFSVQQKHCTENQKPGVYRFSA